MDTNEFRKYAHELVDWMAEYLDHAGSYPVRSTVRPRDILRQIPESPPQKGEAFEAIFEDFKTIVLPGMTHWQSPSFFAYFPGNTSPPSILAEMLTATLGAQCMSWITSPSATELEERMMKWLAGMIGLPETFTGVIQDTASTSTLCALLTARERASQFSVNARGFSAREKFTVYCSAEAHSSIEKGAKIAGLGRENVRKVPVDESFAMRADALEQMLEEDRAAGYTPLCVVAALGTTGSTAIDPIRQTASLCRRHNAWLHIDAAYAGSALILPELRWMSEGVELCDSFVFNPHKWLFTNFDCSAYFVKDVGSLVRTFEILPEYLKTSEGERVNNYRDWGIQLGRRFRALKLWFVIRSFGVDGLQEKLRLHIRMAHDLADQMRSQEDFELLAPVPLNVVCFRYRPKGAEPDVLDDLNARLLESLNATGKLYLTHTRLAGKFTLRIVVGQTSVQPSHVGNAWRIIQEKARSLT